MLIKSEFVVGGLQSQTIFSEIYLSQHVSNLSISSFSSVIMRKNHISCDQIWRSVQKWKWQYCLGMQVSHTVSWTKQSSPPRNRSNKAGKLTQNKSNKAILRSTNKKQWSITIRETNTILSNEAWLWPQPSRMPFENTKLCHQGGWVKNSEYRHQGWNKNECSSWSHSCSPSSSSSSSSLLLVVVS